MSDKVNILVVEDEPGVSMVIVHLLTRAGCDVATAWNSQKGIKLAQANNFDLITLDIDMPEASGFSVCETLKEDPRLSHTPVVFVTAWPCDADRRHAFELGAVDYIIKPFEATDFIYRIISYARRMGNVCETNS
jgi:DNA-binding response OmpR family regulator